MTRRKYMMMRCKYMCISSARSSIRRVWTILSFAGENGGVETTGTNNVRQWSILALVNGAFAGLAVITPGSAYFSVYWSPVVGAIGSAAAYFFLGWLDRGGMVEDVG